MVATKTARGLTCFIIICSTAGAFAGWSAYTSHPPEAALQGARFELAGAAVEPLSSNTVAKGDRLGSARMVLASADPSVTTLTILPVSPSVVPEPRINAAVPLPPVKPKNLAAQPTQQSGGQLDESQIAQIKVRLRLTPSQEQYWPAVEAALRDVLRQHAREARRTGAQRAPANIDVNSPEVQRLTWAAMPLLMQLREDQKHEVRKFARAIGLDSVAAQI